MQMQTQMQIRTGNSLQTSLGKCKYKLAILSVNTHVNTKTNTNEKANTNASANTNANTNWQVEI